MGWREGHIEKKYADKFIAIVNHGEILADANLGNLLTILKKKKIDIDTVPIMGFPPAGEADILWEFLYK